MIVVTAQRVRRSAVLLVVVMAVSDGVLSPAVGAVAGNQVQSRVAPRSTEPGTSNEPRRGRPVVPLSGTAFFRADAEVHDWPEPRSPAALGPLDSDGPAEASGPAEHDRLWAWNFASGAYYEVSATLRYSSAEIWVYVEDGAEVPQPAVDEIAVVFEEQIGPRLRSAFGNEPNPGADGERAVTVLLHDVRDPFAYGGATYVSGYFLPTNQYGQADLDARLPGHKSNEREMLYLDIAPTAPNGAIIRQTLAHEFQHLIHWNYDKSEAPWLDEALSELAVFVAGLGHPLEHVRAFLAEPSRSLLEWTGSPADYGLGYLFLLYQYEQNPDREWIRAVVADTGDGLTSLERVFGGADALERDFRDFAVALFHDEADPNNRHAFRSLELGSSSITGVPFPRVHPPATAPAIILRPWSIGGWLMPSLSASDRAAVYTARPTCLSATMRSSSSVDAMPPPVRPVCSGYDTPATWDFADIAVADASTRIFIVGANTSQSDLSLRFGSAEILNGASHFSLYLPLSVTRLPNW